MIKETNNYTLVVASSLDGAHELCYQIINKEHGVIEVETSILPQAIKYLLDLEVSLQAMIDMKAEDDAQLDLSNVTSIGKKH